ncbi:MAG: TolC family protein, partial [Acetobacteraceae bacterium]|nr:TolC family protein [Acetobacteraceae bacterium]
GGAAQAQTSTIAPSQTPPSIAQPLRTLPAAGSAPLTLNEAIGIALRVNPSAAAASQQLAQAQAAVNAALAQRRMQVTFSSAGSVSSADVPQPPPSHETFGTLQNTINVPLPVGRRPGFAVAQAREQLAGAEAMFRAARLSLATQVAAAYFDLLRKRALLAAAQETLDLARRQLTDAQNRAAAGDVPQIDVLQAEVPVATAEAAQSQAATAAVIAQESFNDLLARPLDEPASIEDVIAPPSMPPYTLDQARNVAVYYSPSVVAADASTRAALAAVASARAYREPSVSLQLIDTRSGDVTSFSREDTLQAAVSIPLTDGGLGRAQTEAAQAVLAQSQAQAESARRAAVVGASAAYLTAQSNAAQVGATRTARDIAQTTYDKTVLGYRNGTLPLVDVLTAQNALAQTRIAYIQALYDAAAAQASLLAAIRGEVVTIPAQPVVSGALAVPQPAAAPPSSGISPAGAGSPTGTPA